MPARVMEAEIRFKIEQALHLAPVQTIGMLQAFLTSRISNGARDLVLDKMVRDGKIRFETRHFVSFRGHASSAKVIVWLGTGASGGALRHG